MICFLVLIANAEDVDLQDRLEESKTLGRNHGERARVLAEMAVPNIQKFGQIVDIGQVALRLNRVRQGTAAGFERRLEPRSNKKLGLQPDVGSVPNGIGRAVGRFGDPGHVVVVWHLAGDKHIVATDERSDEAGVLGNRYAFRLRWFRLTAAARQDGNHGHLHVGAVNR
jgi:hypothetical protein